MSEPVISVVGAGGGSGVTTLTTLMGPVACELDAGALEESPPPEWSPWVIIVASESVDQASHAVWLREQALDSGWRVAAIVTRGPEKKRPRQVEARFIPIADDPVDTVIVRMPWWSQVSRMPGADLPRWDFTRQEKRGRRADGVPKQFAVLFTRIMDYIALQTAADEVFEHVG